MALTSSKLLICARVSVVVVVFLQPGKTKKLYFRRSCVRSIGVRDPVSCAFMVIVTNSERRVFWSGVEVCQFFGGHRRVELRATLSSGTEDHSRRAGGRSGRLPDLRRSLARALRFKETGVGTYTGTVEREVTVVAVAATAEVVRQELGVEEEVTVVELLHITRAGIVNGAGSEIDIIVELGTLDVSKDLAGVDTVVV